MRTIGALVWEEARSSLIYTWSIRPPGR